MSSAVVTNARPVSVIQSSLLASCTSLREDSLSMASGQKAYPVVFLHRPSGIHSLPVELLTQIFNIGAEFDDPYADSPFLLRPERAYSSPALSNFPIFVTHVCHHWREVALGTSTLWTTLHFREKAHIPRAGAYLQRCSKSASSKLNILIDSVAEVDHIPGVTLYKDEVDTIFRLILPYVQRWRAFHLKICDNACKGLARQYLNTCGPAPSLETLQLYHFEDYRTTQNLYLATYRPPVVVFDNCLPRLSNVSLIGVNLPWEKSPFLAGLRHLELALHPENIRPPYQCWSQMLAQSPQLETLCLHYSGPKSMGFDAALAWPPVKQALYLPKLQEITLTNLDPDYAGGLVERIHIPNIKRLTLDLLDQDCGAFLQVLTKSTTKVDDSTEESNSPSGLSFSALGELRIHALECSTERWTSFLRAAHQTQVLEIDFTRVPQKLWTPFTSDILSTGSDSSTKIRPLLPDLRELRICGLTGEVILEGLRRRYSAGAEHAVSIGIRWIIGWSETCKGKDVKLNELVERGYWVSDDDRWQIDIEAFDDDQEGEEVDDDVAEVVNQNEFEGEEVNKVLISGKDDQ